MQTATAINTRRPAFRPEFVPATARQEKRSPQARRLLITPAQTEEAQLAHSGVIKIDQAARTKATIALIESEFKNRRGLYLHSLRRAGIPPHELEDALCEVFSLAVHWAGSYESSKSSIASWLGNQIVRTVASSTYGTRRPGWRRQQEHELPAETLVTGAMSESSEITIDGSDDTTDPTEELAVAAFMDQLTDELTDTEAAALNICGMDLLHERLATQQLDKLRDLLGVSSLSSVRSFTNKLGNKLRELALEHFGVEELLGRPGFDKLAA
ncbi:hypothetical protein LH460_09330 [Laribacter hongkongensis]|uniref:hypothetical protein n=1 Tax=Laribacter hongkongensis TaxID=168471 RepID=UPI001EFE2E64|nr:hypothetical protein [Laribacter hongkongensis]MCG9124873.1 hypothetical protein [Laribacter hongkongensis]